MGGAGFGGGRTGAQWEHVELAMPAALPCGGTEEAVSPREQWVGDRNFEVVRV